MDAYLWTDICIKNTVFVFEDKAKGQLMFQLISGCIFHGYCHPAVFLTPKPSEELGWNLPSGLFHMSKRPRVHQWDGAGTSRPFSSILRPLVLGVIHGEHLGIVSAVPRQLERVTGCLAVGSETQMVRFSCHPACLAETSGFHSSAHTQSRIKCAHARVCGGLSHTHFFHLHWRLSLCSRDTWGECSSGIWFIESHSSEEQKVSRFSGQTQRATTHRDHLYIQKVQMLTGFPPKDQLFLMWKSSRNSRNIHEQQQFSCVIL